MAVRMIIAAAVFSACLSYAVLARAHCEIPCGIYNDGMRLDMISEHAATIEKSINAVNELSKEEDRDYNQIVRWTENKEAHAVYIQDIVTRYFMAQRIKPPAAGDAAAQEAYEERLTLLHRMLVYAMKAKQSLDMDNVVALRSALAGFRAAYLPEGGKDMANTAFQKIAQEAEVKDGVKEISYEQFMGLRESGADYVLLDVLLPDNYGAGHIEGAESFPVTDINKENAEKRLSKDAKVVVYCANFHCSASTNAAKKLSGLGYDVLDYKGGLKEWQERGNKLVK